MSKSVRLFGLCSVLLASFLVFGVGYAEGQNCPRNPEEWLKLVRIPQGMHRPEGRLDVDKLIRRGVQIVKVPRAAHYSNVNLKKLIFAGKGPALEDIKQTGWKSSSRNCGFLAPLATIVASPQGGLEIENRMYDDGKGKVFVSLIHPRRGVPILVEVDKSRDTTRDAKGRFYHSQVSSGSRLWVHIFERAIDAVIRSLQKNNKTETEAFTVYSAFFGPDIPVYVGSDVTAVGKDSLTYSIFDDSSQKNRVRGNFYIPLTVYVKDYYARYVRGSEASDLWSGHFYASVSDGCVNKNGEEGVWIFNTLNMDNSLLGKIKSRNSSRLFFYTQDELVNNFTSAVSTKISAY